MPASAHGSVLLPPVWGVHSLKKIVLVCGAAAAALTLSACATITRGSSQKFTIESSPTEADAKLSTGQTCVTPCTLTLKRKSQFKVTVSKDGYKPSETEVHGKIKGGGAAGFAGNAIVGGLIGAGVDAATGASLSLDPNPLKVTLVPVDQAPLAAAAPADVAPVAAVETVAIPAPAGETDPVAGSAAAAPAPEAAPAVASTPGGE